ncbi:hypothetical protein ABFS83_10G173500 [Erythranthe nasuta]
MANCPSSNHIFSIKPSSCSISSMKLKTLLQTFIFSHMYRIIARALTKAKSIIIQLLNKHNYYKQKKKNKLFFDSFRMHYNWSSSRTFPVGLETYSDSGWNSVIPIPFEFSGMQEYSNELSKYLQWLEEKGGEEEYSSNEIDKLADLFIANCHEKFLLEKQESYRIFQEMMARSV